jgi:hypothetical protein
MDFTHQSILSGELRVKFLDIRNEDGIVLAGSRNYGPGDPIFDLHTGLDHFSSEWRIF